MMTTLLESGTRPYSSKKGIAISMVLHGALLAAAVFATSRVVLPPREKVEEHPILYVATPPPPALTPPPEPLPVVKTPPKSPAKVFKAPPAPPRRAPQPVAQVPPKGPTTPALVAPTKINVGIPAINPNAIPTISDVVAPPPPAASSGSGIPTTGTASRDSDAGGRGLNSGSSGKAYDEDQVDQAVQVRNQPAPRYPDALRSVGVEGTVIVRFIVSAEGRVESGSIEAIDSPNKLFTDAVRTALLNSRYRPAEAGGNKVRQLVEQSFTFKLAK